MLLMSIYCDIEARFILSGSQQGYVSSPQSVTSDGVGQQGCEQCCLCHWLAIYSCCIGALEGRWRSLSQVCVSVCGERGVVVVRQCAQDLVMQTCGWVKLVIQMGARSGSTGNGMFADVLPHLAATANIVKVVKWQVVCFALLGTWS